MTAGAGSAQFFVVGDVPQVSWACRVNGVEILGCTSPLEWSGKADGSTLTIEVTATDLDTGIEAAPLIVSATVDAAPPTIENVNIVPLLGDTTGPMSSFSFSSSGTLEDGTVFQCAIDGVVYQCLPDTAIPVAEPDGVGKQLLITAIDPVGNNTVFMFFFNVDARGPVFDPVNTRVPASAVCPNSTEDTEIRFLAADPSPPVAYRCSLDQTTFETCGISPVEPVYRWSELTDGAHALTVVAYDFFMNPSVPLVVEFVVDSQQDVNGDGVPDCP